MLLGTDAQVTTASAGGAGASDRSAPAGAHGKDANQQLQQAMAEVSSLREQVGQLESEAAKVKLLYMGVMHQAAYT